MTTENNYDMIRSPLLKRLAEVLETLKFTVAYIRDDNILVLPNEDCIFFETHMPDLNIYERPFKKQNVFRINPDGSMVRINGDSVEINECKQCHTFFLEMQNENSKQIATCPKCGSQSYRKLCNHHKIPGWKGTPKDVLVSDEEIQKHLDTMYGEAREQVELVLDKIQGEVDYIKVTDEKIQAVEELGKKYPNMQEVVDYMIQSFKTCMLRKNRDIGFKPFVLVGGPGCGTSSFTTELCMIIQGHRPIKVDLGNGIADCTLSGTEPSFKNAKVGIVAESMMAQNGHNPIKNPVILFDELDKIKSDRQYSAENVFYAMLEKNTARYFMDNFLELNIDASGVNYIFTANTLEKIPKPFLSRLRVFEIPDYTHEQIKEIVIDSIYKNWLTNNKMETEFLPAVLSDYIKDEILKECNDDPRQIEDAIGTVFARTMLEDSETHHIIALFSPDEIKYGWENYRGAPLLSTEKWKLPQGFGVQKEDEKPFNLAEYLMNYEPNEKA